MRKTIGDRGSADLIESPANFESVLSSGRFVIGDPDTVDYGDWEVAGAGRSASAQGLTVPRSAISRPLRRWEGQSV